MKPRSPKTPGLLLVARRASVGALLLNRLAALLPDQTIKSFLRCSVIMPDQISNAATVKDDSGHSSVRLLLQDAAIILALDIPPAHRKIITTHDAFGYFGAAYRMEFIAPEGVSTESEASAKDVAKIIRQIKAEKIPAVFLENVDRL